MTHRSARLRASLVAAACVPILGSPAAAQATPEEVAAFQAIILTPAGALPQLVRVQRSMDNGSRGEMAVRFGRYNFRNQSGAFENIGVTGMLHLFRRVQVGATGGYRTCSGCQGLFMGSVDFGTRLLHKRASGDIGGDTDVGLQVSAGIGKSRVPSSCSALNPCDDVSARSVVVSVPLAVTLPQPENALLILFLSPSLGYGSLTDAGATLASMRGIIGAGVAYVFPFGLGAHASAHRVIIDDSPTQFGFALSWSFGGGNP